VGCAFEVIIMENKKVIRVLIKVISYVLVAALACVITLVLYTPVSSFLPTVYPTGTGEATDEVEATTQKLRQLLNLIDQCFIGQADMQVLGDAAANAIVAATGDQWSAYISEDALAAYVENQNNAYVGIGITILADSSDEGFLIQQVEPNGSAKAAGILPGDILVEAEGQPFAGKTTDFAASIIRGEEGTEVTVKVRRGDQILSFTMTRMTILTQVAFGKMLEDNIGYIQIANFNQGCADQTIAVIEQLRQQGAEGLILDVRFNPGGYKYELVNLLDYLLPSGDLFRSVDYTGQERVDRSDEGCLPIPMCVLVNNYSYSAAEFFAAALSEYNWATVIGEPTVGKSYFQMTLDLQDGSAVALSTGKYFTPKGVSLADEGGLQPDVIIDLDDETEALVYANLLDPADDPHIQAAIAALSN
jgi:carboxyl-terminal processing protease